MVRFLSDSVLRDTKLQNCRHINHVPLDNDQDSARCHFDVQREYTGMICIEHRFGVQKLHRVTPEENTTAADFLV